MRTEFKIYWESNGEPNEATFSGDRKWVLSMAVDFIRRLADEIEAHP